MFPSALIAPLSLTKKTPSTLATGNMRELVRFYCAFGIALDHGGEDATFTCQARLNTWRSWVYERPMKAAELTPS